MSSRRHFLRAISSASLAAILAACAAPPPRKAARVVIVGGGFGGATAAKYLRMWSAGKVAVTLIERAPAFVSCPLSNLVVAGFCGIDELTRSHQQLARRWGVHVVLDEASAIDLEGREVRTRSGARFAGEHLVLSPGVDFIAGAVPGLEADDTRVPHAWKAGAQTQLLHAQLHAMADGGVFAIHIPPAPFRCPPGPYERACVVADWLRGARPRSKVLVLDSNAEIQSKKRLFTAAFASYGDLIEYRPDSRLLALDPAQRRLELEFDSVTADVLNVIPPMRAGRIAVEAGLPLINGRWVDVDWLSLQARGVPGVHVLGDALAAAPGMPKSGHMANQHGKLAAAAILNALDGRPPDAAPVLMNTCYSFVDHKQVIHVASVHQFDAASAQPLPVAGAGGVSAAPSLEEGFAAWAWARNIWADMLD